MTYRNYVVKMQWEILGPGCSGTKWGNFDTEQEARRDARFWFDRLAEQYEWLNEKDEYHYEFLGVHGFAIPESVYLRKELFTPGTPAHKLMQHADFAVEVRRKID